MAYLTGFDRQQTALIPQCIDELIPEDSLVRIIDVFVDSLPMEKLGFMDEPTSSDGRPSYHPNDLFKLYVYGYLNRVRTSRLLERECQRNIEMMWLLKGLQPCFRTIAGFRSEKSQALRNTFKHFVGSLNKAGLIGGKTVAIDSSKFRAVNSKKNNFNIAKIKRQLEYIDEKVNQYMKDLDQGDLNEQQEEIIHQKIKKQKVRKAKYNRLEKQLDASGETQISTTDSDARSMILHGSVIEVAFNVQTTVDEKHKLIVDYEPTNTNDRKALLPTSLRAKEICKAENLTVLLDKGYFNAEQIDSCTKEGIITYVSPQVIPRSNPVPIPEYYGDKFIYNTKKDTYICPAGHTMRTNGNWYEKKYKESITKVRHYKTQSCKGCPVRSNCTTNPNNRIIERSQYADSVEQNNNRVNNDFPTYQKRQQIIEHVFGTIKRQWGYDHILLKGLKKNQGEFGLIFLIYNFRRLINILKPSLLKRWMRALFSLVLIPRWFRKYSMLKFENHFFEILLSQIGNFRFWNRSYCTN